MVIWIVFIIGRVVASLKFNAVHVQLHAATQPIQLAPRLPSAQPATINFTFRQRDNSENHCRTTQPSGQIREQSGATDAGWAVSSHVVAALWSAGRGGRRHAIREPVAAVAAAASAQRDRSRLVGPGVSRRLMAMSDRRLPENLDQWPNDPFSLLGVNHASNRREVRRAYAQLIRIYKPEHFPEQFRRIRDAYELLDQRLSWMESNAAAAAELQSVCRKRGGRACRRQRRRGRGDNHETNRLSRRSRCVLPRSIATICGKRPAKAIWPRHTRIIRSWPGRAGAMKNSSYGCSGC